MPRSQPLLYNRWCLSAAKLQNKPIKRAEISQNALGGPSETDTPEIAVDNCLDLPDKDMNRTIT